MAAGGWVGNGVRAAAFVDGRLGTGVMMGLAWGAGCELALVAEINVPTGRQVGIPSRQTSAPSPSLPPRRARMSCSIVISTKSGPPRSTYQSGLSVGASDAWRGRPCAGDDGLECDAPLGAAGREERSSSARLGRGERPPSTTAAVAEFIKCVASSSSRPARTLVISTGGGVGSERRSTGVRSRRTK